MNWGVRGRRGRGTYQFRNMYSYHDFCTRFLPGPLRYLRSNQTTLSISDLLNQLLPFPPFSLAPLYHRLCLIQIPIGMSFRIEHSRDLHRSRTQLPLRSDIRRAYLSREQDGGGGLSFYSLKG